MCYYSVRVEDNIMVVNNVLFKTHLNYQIQASIDEQKDDNLDDLCQGE